MPELKLAVTADASAAAASLESVGSAARGMATDVEAAASSADTAVGRMDGLAGSADNLDSKASQATGAFGALAGGLEAAGFEGAAAGLQGVAVATDFASGAGGLFNLVLETQAAQFVIGKAQAVAHAAATGAQATATGIATGAQWLWNAALSANPIGLLIVGLAAVTGGLILAYNKVEPFRDAVDAAMGLAKDAIGFVVDKLEDLGGWVGKASDGWGAIKSAAEGALEPVETAVGGVSTALENAVGWVQDLIEWIGKIDFPDVDLPFGLRTGEGEGGTVTKDQLLQLLAQQGLLASATFEVKAARQDKDAATRQLLEELTEYAKRHGWDFTFSDGLPT